MPLKKTLLSILMIFAFGGWALYERANNDQGDLIALVASGLSPRSQDYAAAQAPDSSGVPGSAPQPVAAQPARTPRPLASRTQSPPPREKSSGQPAEAAQTQNGMYRDGAYTGPSVDVYYGYVQVQAIVQGGALADVRFLQYPSDHSTSRFINSQAMPLLKQEAIQAQSAQVDGVSGASDTSQGFIQSLGAALASARA